MTSRFTNRDLQFEEVLRDGISAAKSGERAMAARLLERALLLKQHDARPYIWLSATTDDRAQQRDYLEQALAVDPSNATARRGLAALGGKFDQSRLLKEGPNGEYLVRAPQERETVVERSFACPQCGGHMVFSVSTAMLTCEYCGYEMSQFAAPPGSPGEAAPPPPEELLDFVLPTNLGHHWAQDQHRVSCSSCGAVSLLAPGEKATKCAYCGSNQMIDLSEAGELIDPHVIALMKVDEGEAIKNVRAWLGRGFFTPDNLLSAIKGLRLRPAYYSAWIFDGTLEIRWTCEVQEGSGRYQRWETRTGSDSRFFSDVLVSGVRSLTTKELTSIEPFDLADVETFKPEYLAGWTTVIYDRPVSDASLVGREKVLRQLRPQMYSMIEIGQEKRNIQIGAGSWSGMSFKHILLPIWIGTYHFKGQEFHLLVNGQTGKVGGEKPRDNFKITFAGLTALVFVALVVVLYFILRARFGAP